ncbi:uncharacterized protein LOC103312575 [Tribolium castaneum]|uniref:Protein TsetseEP domain-containing protein n=1 Tax=Tribolium castaneum TaxID=7070 RepID=D2A3D0_TRICA|nr:PREDICTED: uncharacterized protein LOC100141699 [Tribolium castaneum]EFA02295.2 hypothetical protein TcasGA2_TC007959 [Tribolium castaneum]|eukprot:XP_001816173.1 PREDICTED: uncharacterized protein LOC100141699 [Tribolium castaneum]
MRFFTLIIFALVALQLCRSSTVTDAETKLQRLRELTTHKLQSAFLDHTRMSNEIDATALAAKEHGKIEIQKKTDKYLAKLKADKALTQRCRGSRDHIFDHLKQSNIDELIRCVDHAGGQSVNVLAAQRLSLSEYVWDAIYEEEKHIIVCGQNHKCLAAAVADLEDKIDEVRKVIEAEVEISKHNKEVQVQVIKACASKSIANVEHELSTIPTCMY